MLIILLILVVAGIFLGIYAFSEFDVHVEKQERKLDPEVSAQARSERMEVRLKELEAKLASDEAEHTRIQADIKARFEQSRKSEETLVKELERQKQFGSTNAIPALKAAAMNTTDTEEQIALLEAADFLSLPSVDFSEPAAPKTPEQIQADAQRKAGREAHRQERLQKRTDNQNPQSPPDQNSPAPSNQ